MQSYAHLEVEYLNPGLSDHSPLLMKWVEEISHKGRPFRFLNYMLEHDDFDDTVSWCGSGLAKIWQQLKQVKVALKTLHNGQLHQRTG